MQADKRVIQAIRQGSKQALSQVYAAYRDDLLRLAASLLCQKGLAEDVVHDVFLSFVQAVPTLQLRKSLKAYLLTSVANRARNMNRDNGRRPEQSWDAEDVLPSRHQRPDQWMIASEALEQLAHVLGQLPYEQREVIVLHLLGEMTFREIASQQESSIKTVQSRYRYGIDKLRSLLSSEVML